MTISKKRLQYLTEVATNAKPILDQPGYLGELLGAMAKAAKPEDRERLSLFFGALDPAEIMALIEQAQK
jgi:hypothetical protein